MSIIYDTKGKAREYFQLAANLYKGCQNRCAYCYVPLAMHQTRWEFHEDAIPKDKAIERIKKDAEKLEAQKETRKILMSFACDPYPNWETCYRITRGAIRVLHSHGLNVAILTKNTGNASQDFRILTENDVYGTTLTFINPADSQAWEPGADLPESRLYSLEWAHSEGIQTFASMEPVISPRQTLELIEKSAPFTDHYKVGKLNYEKSVSDSLSRVDVDWRQFALDVIALLDRLGKPYYIKKELARFINQPDGITKGSIPV